MVDSPLPENAGQIPHPAKQAPHCTGHLHILCPRIGQKLIDLFVAEPASAFDRRSLDFRMDRDSLS